MEEVPTCEADYSISTLLFSLSATKSKKFIREQLFSFQYALQLSRDPYFGSGPPSICKRRPEHKTITELR